MPIRPRGSRFEVTVQRASALPGFQRIRRLVPTREEAEKLEQEINSAIEVYGKWPLSDDDTPLHTPAKLNAPAKVVHKAPPKRTGTLREAADHAKKTHWIGQRYLESVRYMADIIVEFFEERLKPDLDDITSEDIDALITSRREAGNEAVTINKYLGALRVINDVALKRKPPLATITLPVPSLKAKRVEKWWLRPDDHRRVVAALRNPMEGSLITDLMFADIIDIIVYQGLRIEEALRLEARMFVGLDSSKPWFNPAGTKTADAQNAIPVYPEALEPIKRSIARAAENRWPRLFPITPRQAGYLWDHVREFLGVQDVPTATMKSLRRTFAWYANQKGMPTSTLQKVLRHRNIGTTAGYLELVGDGALEDSRKYFEDDSTKTPTVGSQQGGDIKEAIAAYASLPGVTPEAVARFVKELMG
ncbi:tyrosine-type recombinase/integrase [Brucella intermedia]|uniref:tyrosine-type recombinase/integrase n=1 Tax=Brucella intermedia TaxID=94625 RepID=UPI00224B6A8F|nr:tyrosine-type recombinase/integrase [Brucella intermedia]